MTRSRQSLAERTVAQLRERLRSEYQPGDCLPPLRGLCAALGVSLNTLRAALALLAREGRVEIRHGAGVFVRAPAQRPRIGVLSELNLLLPVCTYHRHLANETLLLLREQGMTPHLFCGTVQPGESPEEPTCPEFWEAVNHQRLDGAIILNTPCNDPWFQRVAQAALPLVGELTPYRIPHADVRLVVEPGLHALSRHGARRIALLTAAAGQVRPLFERTVRELGLRTAPGWIAGPLAQALPAVGRAAFRQIWQATDEKPDGVLITNDLLFSGATEAIHELRIAVPGQLRVVTHANRGDDSPPPPFPHTRLEFDPHDFALALVGLLQLRLAGKRPPDTPPPAPYRVVEADGEPAPTRAVGPARAAGAGPILAGGTGRRNGRSARHTNRKARRQSRQPKERAKVQ